MLKITLTFILKKQKVRLALLQTNTCVVTVVVINYRGLSISTRRLPSSLVLVRCWTPWLGIVSIRLSFEKSCHRTPIAGRDRSFTAACGSGSGLEELREELPPDRFVELARQIRRPYIGHDRSFTAAASDSGSSGSGLGVGGA